MNELWMFKLPDYVKKIETDIKKPLCIQTVRGQGYMLVLK